MNCLFCNKEMITREGIQSFLFFSNYNGCEDRIYFNMELEPEVIITSTIKILCIDRKININMLYKDIFNIFASDFKILIDQGYLI